MIAGVLQIEEARKNEGERTGKAHEDMARAKAELKRLEKELASLQVLPLASPLLPCHLCTLPSMGAGDLPPSQVLTCSASARHTWLEDPTVSRDTSQRMQSYILIPTAMSASLRVEMAAE